MLSVIKHMLLRQKFLENCVQLCITLNYNSQCLHYYVNFSHNRGMFRLNDDWGIENISEHIIEYTRESFCKQMNNCIKDRNIHFTFI